MKTKQILNRLVLIEKNNIKKSNHPMMIRSYKARIVELKLIYSILLQFKKESREIKAFWIYDYYLKNRSKYSVKLSRYFWNKSYHRKLVNRFAKETNLFKPHVNKHLCSTKGCMKARVKTITRTKRGKITSFGYCKKHLEQFIKEHNNRAEFMNVNRVILANARSLTNFENNIDQVSGLKHLDKIKLLITDFYLNNPVSEPFFAILISDILRLQGGDPVHEYPYWTPTGPQNHLRPDGFADIYDRKFKLAIEVKAAFFNSSAQTVLSDQLKEYKSAFSKDVKVLGICPDAHTAQAYNYYPTDLYDFLRNIKKYIK